MRRIAQVNAAYDRYLERGFPTADFDGQPESETLQCRNELDRTNWMGLLIKCLALRDEGYGEAPIDPPIRCTSNRMYAVTVNDCIARMFALLELVGAAQSRWWALKDAVRDCPTRQGLAEIDLEAGWP